MMRVLAPLFLFLLLGCVQAPEQDTFNQRCADETQTEIEKFAESVSLLDGVIEDITISVNIPSCAGGSRVQVIEGNPIQCSQYCARSTGTCTLVEHQKDSFRFYQCIPLSPAISLFPDSCHSQIPAGYTALENYPVLNRGRYYLSAQSDAFGQTRAVCGFYAPV